MKTLTPFRPEDDLLHAESAVNDSSRESMLLTAPIPEENLLVFLYLWREGGTKWGRFFFVGGTDMAKPEFLTMETDGKYTGDDLRDFEVSGLRWRQPEPLKVAEISFADDECELELRFEGLHHPFDYHDNADGCPPEYLAARRYEQSGRTSGVLRLRGREIVIDGFGHRDHSWGQRNWNPFLEWKWMNAASHDGSTSVHCFLYNVKGEIFTNGYTNRNGVVTPIIQGAAKAELDENLTHRRIVGRFVDESGSEMNLDARFAAGWSMPIRHLLLNEIGMSGTLDGKPATAHVEMGWPVEYVQRLTNSA